jgi:SM-20-related protein
MIQKFNAIVDGLAEEGYAVCDNFLNEFEVTSILNLPDFQSGLNFKKAGIGKSNDLQINESIRGDYIHWLDKSSSPPAIKVYLDRLNELVQLVNQTLYAGLKDYEVHMTIYPAGTFYKRHLDQFKKDDHRKLSVICYLNKNWEDAHGGQLRVYLPNQTLDITPIAGRLVCFRSDLIEHEVLPATRERLSLTGWLLNQYADLKYL